VAVPGSSEQIAETLFEGALFREKTGADPKQLRLAFIDEMELKKEALHAEWENARDREKASRCRFALHTLSPEAVAHELQSVRAAIGGSEDVARFVYEVLHAAGVPVENKDKAVTVHISKETPRAVRQAAGLDEPFTGRFDLPLGEGEIYLGRTSPIVEGLAGWTLDQALDAVARDAKSVTARCGVISTSAVKARTTLLVTRPERNLIPTAVDQQIGLLMEALPKLQDSLASVATERASAQLAAHERVRESLRARGRVTIQPVLPVDILGAYVIVPIPRAGGTP